MNKESLSINKILASSLELEKDLNKMSINNDFSNDEYIEDDYSIIENNSYIDLTDSLDEANKFKKRNKTKVNFSSIAYDNEMTD